MTVTAIQDNPSNADVSSTWKSMNNNVYYNTGNVGIGNTSPTEKLELDGVVKINSTSAQTYAHNGLMLTNTTNNKSYRIYVNNSSAHNNFHILMSLPVIKSI